MLAERLRHVMVLAVNITRDHAAEVTNWVPGETGVKKPRCMNTRRSSYSEQPASARRTPVSLSKAKILSASVVFATGLHSWVGKDESP